MQISEADREIFANVHKCILERRRGFYETGVQTTILQKQGSEWRNLLSKLDFVCKGTTGPAPLSHQYEGIVLVRRLLSVEEVGGVVFSLLDKDELRTGYPTIETVPLSAAFSRGGRVRLYRSEWTDWPAEVYNLEPRADQFRPSLSFDSLVALEAPYFPSPEQLLAGLFGVRAPGWSGYFRGQVVLVTPDFRSRISKLIIGFDYVRAELECVFAPPGDLVAKLYACNSVNQLAQETIPLTELALQHNFRDKPSLVSLSILSKLTGEVLDEKSYKEGWAWHDPAVLLEASEPDIEQMLLIGESETLEFREKLDSGRPQRLAKTAVAFANTKGGTIVFGVDDDHHAIGCETKGLADTVTNILRTYCDPPPSFTTQAVAYGDKQLMLIRVAESKEIVHVVKDLGPFIRANGTNRSPTNYELDNLYQRRSAR